MALEERSVGTSLWPRLTHQSRALFRSQGGPLGSVPFTSFPVAHHSRFDSQRFRMLLLRRLWLPLPSAARICWRGLPLDSCVHDHAACSVAGVLGRRRQSVGERPRAGRGLGPSRRVGQPLSEIVADGLPLFQRAQLPVDTTLMSVLRRDGVPRQQAATHDRAALTAARRRKERVYPELTGQMGRTRLVVLAREVGVHAHLFFFLTGA